MIAGWGRCTQCSPAPSSDQIIPKYSSHSPDLQHTAPMRLSILIALVLALAGCGGSSSPAVTGSTTSSSETYSTYASAHFSFRYTSLDASTIATTAARVEAEYSRIVADLGSDSSMPTLTSLSMPTTAVEIGAQTISVPSWASGLATSQTQIHLMSPNLPQWGSYDH